MNTRAAALVALVGLALIPAPKAHSYCLLPGHHGTEYIGYHLDAVPVYIHPDLLSHLRHPDGTQWHYSELVDAVRWTLDMANSSSRIGVHPQFYFAGDVPSLPACDLTVDEDPNCLIPGAISILPTSPNWCVSKYYSPSNTHTDGSVIYIARFWARQSPSTPFGDCYDWTHTQLGPGYGPFEPNLLHELGHALGLGHNWDPSICDPDTTANVISCARPGCNVMEIPGAPAEIYEGWLPDDLNGLLAAQLYPGETNHFYGVGDRPWQETVDDGVSFSSGRPPFLAAHIDARFGLNSTPGELLWAAGSPPIDQAPGTQVSSAVRGDNWQLHTNGWEVGPAIGYLSVTQAGEPEAAFLFQAKYPPETDSSLLIQAYSVSTSAGGSPLWEYAPQVNNLPVLRQGGIAATFDPVSQMVAVAYRDDSGKIHLLTQDASGGFNPQYDYELGNESAGPPSLACRPGVEPPEHNCAMVWASSGDEAAYGYGRFLMWRSFRMEDSSLMSERVQFGTPVVIGGRPHQPPSLVSFRNTEDEYDFLMNYVHFKPHPLYPSLSVSDTWLLRWTASFPAFVTASVVAGPDPLRASVATGELLSLPPPSGGVHDRAALASLHVYYLP